MSNSKIGTGNNKTSVIREEFDKVFAYEAKPVSAHEIYEQVKEDLKDWQTDRNTRLGALAHSRPALEIRAPAFFRHVMIFFPHDQEESKQILYPGDFRRHHGLRKIVDTVGKLAGIAIVPPLSEFIYERHGFIEEIKFRYSREESFFGSVTLSAASIFVLLLIFILSMPQLVWFSIITPTYPKHATLQKL